MQAVYNFETLLKRNVSVYADRFQSSPTVANAKRFNAAYQMLYKTYGISVEYARRYA